MQEMTVSYHSHCRFPSLLFFFSFSLGFSWLSAWAARLDDCQQSAASFGCCPGYRRSCTYPRTQTRTHARTYVLTLTLREPIKKRAMSLNLSSTRCPAFNSLGRLFVVSFNAESNRNWIGLVKIVLLFLFYGLRLLPVPATTPCFISPQCNGTILNIARLQTVIHLLLSLPGLTSCRKSPTFLLLLLPGDIPHELLLIPSGAQLKVECVGPWNVERGAFTVKIRSSTDSISPSILHCCCCNCSRVHSRGSSQTDALHSLVLIYFNRVESSWGTWSRRSLSLRRVLGVISAAAAGGGPRVCVQALSHPPWTCTRCGRRHFSFSLAQLVEMRKKKSRLSVRWQPISIFPWFYWKERKKEGRNRCWEERSFTATPESLNIHRSPVNRHKIFHFFLASFIHVFYCCAPASYRIFLKKALPVFNKTEPTNAWANKHTGPPLDSTRLPPLSGIDYSIEYPFRWFVRSARWMDACHLPSVHWAKLIFHRHPAASLDATSCWIDDRCQCQYLVAVLTLQERIEANTNK